MKCAAVQLCIHVSKNNLLNDVQRMFDKEFLFAYLIYFFLPDVLLTTKLLPVIRPISESTLKGRYQRIRSSFSRQAPSQDI